MFRKAMDIFLSNLKMIFIVGSIIYVPAEVLRNIIPNELNPLIPLLEGRPADFNSNLVFFAVALAIIIFFTPLAQASAACFVYNESPKFETVIEASFVRWGRLVVTNLILYPILLISWFLVVPGIYTSVVFAFSNFIVATTDLTGFDALKKSQMAVQGRFFKTLGFVILIGFLQILMNVIISISFASFNQNIVGTIAVGALIDIMSFYFMILLCLYYKTITGGSNED